MKKSRTKSKRVEKEASEDDEEDPIVVSNRRKPKVPYLDENDWLEYSEQQRKERKEREEKDQKKKEKYDPNAKYWVKGSKYRMNDSLNHQHLDENEEIEADFKTQKFLRDLDDEVREGQKNGEYQFLPRPGQDQPVREVPQVTKKRFPKSYKLVDRDLHDLECAHYNPPDSKPPKMFRTPDRTKHFDDYEERAIAHRVQPENPVRAKSSLKKGKQIDDKLYKDAFVRQLKQEAYPAEFIRNNYPFSPLVNDYNPNKYKQPPKISVRMKKHMLEADVSTIRSKSSRRAFDSENGFKDVLIVFDEKDLRKVRVDTKKLDKKKQMDKLRKMLHDEESDASDLPAFVTDSPVQRERPPTHTPFSISALNSAPAPPRAAAPTIQEPASFFHPPSEPAKPSTPRKISKTNKASKPA